MTLTFKRPNPFYPALQLTDTITVLCLIAPDKPGASDKLMLWVDNPVLSTADEGSGAKLNLSDQAPDEAAAEDRTGSVEALSNALRGQR